jgi:hypothetical protein
MVGYKNGRLEAFEELFAALSVPLRNYLTSLTRDHSWGEPDDRGLWIGLRSTQIDLGQLVGSTLETTSMAFNCSRREGLVESSDRVIWVLDQEAREAY